MKKILLALIIFVLLLSSIILFFKIFKKDTVYLDSEYYGVSNIVEINSDEFKKLENDKSSFIVFIYQPLCAASYEFNDILTEFSNTYKISFYKMQFSNIESTDMNNCIKYYPTAVIYSKGEAVAYLDANNDKDLDYYKSVSGFKKWFTKYVSLNDKKEDNKTIITENSKLEDITFEDNKVNLYFFWGNGCPRCEEEFRFLESIKEEYSKYYNIYYFEVWFNEKNVNILNQFSSVLGETVKGVPYIIIGNKSFVGFGSSMEDEILSTIIEQSKSSYDVYKEIKTE